ncbi:MAG: hypothetical protein GXZ08_09470 [Tissierellia bacterium]|nr:hypothetical protein [Tissierellia bacterium]
MKKFKLYALLMALVILLSPFGEAAQVFASGEMVNITLIADGNMKFLVDEIKEGTTTQVEKTEISVQLGKGKTLNDLKALPELKDPKIKFTDGFKIKEYKVGESILPDSYKFESDATVNIITDKKEYTVQFVSEHNKPEDKKVKHGDKLSGITMS